MADVTSVTRQAQIDNFLDWELREWSNIPWLDSEWDECDQVTRLTIACGWDVVTDRLGELRRWSAQGLMSPEQQQWFEELERVVAQHEPTVKRLFGE